MGDLVINGSGQFEGHWWIEKDNEPQIRIATEDNPERGYNWSEATQILPQIRNACITGYSVGYHNHLVNLDGKTHYVMIDSYAKVTTPKTTDGNYERTNDPTKIPGFRTLKKALELRTMETKPTKEVA